MFTCTGSEANDLALRLAQFHTGGSGVIVTDWAYHGVTQSTAACSPSLGAPGAGPLRVYTVPAPSGEGEGVGAAFAASIEPAILRMQADGVRPAALLVDTLFTSDGVYGAPAGFLQAAVAFACSGHHGQRPPLGRPVCPAGSAGRVGRRASAGQ
jgi:4-aminobutyrate aminotransferase-like enzyme